MPITLGCPSCGKRFRARDESAGKKVKCPYCQAAVQVPTAEESASAAAPTAPLPPPPPVPGSSMSPAVPPPRPAPPPRPLPPPPAPVVATSADWGALPTGPARPAAPPPPPPPPEPEPEPFPPPYSPPAGRGTRERPKPAKAKPAPKGKGADETPEQILAGGWRKCRRGLSWVQFGLFFIALMGFVEFGKMVADRTGNPLPTGDGWIQIEGYINGKGADGFPLSKTDELNIAFYGIPMCLGGLLIVFGRIIAGGVPRSSGAKGLFTLSGLFLLVGLAGAIMAAAFGRIQMKDELLYAMTAAMLLLPLAEFWFLTALTASGLALKRPRTARAVGFVAFVTALLVFAATLGWELYVQGGRPKKPDADTLLYEKGAMMLGWLLLVGVYWRAVGSVRGAVSEFLTTVDEG